jgi:uncharacterized protein with PQ loop repeat
MELVVLPYTAVAVSSVARCIFVYLLYTKRSTNIYSLLFCYLSIISSTFWIPYGIIQNDIPIIVRSSVEIFLLSGCAAYINYNRCHLVIPPGPKIAPINILTNGPPQI